MCKKLIKKNNVINEIDNLKNSANSASCEYNWKDVSLSELLKGDYNYLIEKFILRKDLVPDINYFINNYKYPLDPLFILFL